MSKGMYGAGKLALGGGNVDLVNSSVSALLVDLSHYSPDLINDVSLADIPEDSILADAVLDGKTLTQVVVGGDPFAVFRADNTTFNSVPDEGKVGTAIVIFLDANTYSESTLLIFWDDAPQFPVTPDGTDITIEWDTGDDGIYRF